MSQPNSPLDYESQDPKRPPPPDWRWIILIAIFIAILAIALLLPMFGHARFRT